MRREEYYNDEDETELLTQQGLQSKIWTALPCIITEVDYNKYTVSAQPAIQGVMEDENGVTSYTNLPLLINVPILFPSGGGFHLTVPIKAGDECLVVFSARCIDAWWQSGGVQKPQENRMHDLSDGLCILAPYSQAKAQTAGGFSNNSIVIRDDNSDNIIELVNDGTINIKHSNNLVINTGGSANINVTGDVNLTASNTTINASENTINGNLTVNGLITGTGGFSISGGSGATAKVSGNLEATGDIKARDISLQNHVHGNVQNGGGTTSAAQ